jgi:hypothetical protein
MNSLHNDVIAGTQPTAHWAELQEPVTLCPQSVFVIRRVVQKQKARTQRAFPFSDLRCAGSVPEVSGISSDRAMASPSAMTPFAIGGNA